MEGPSLVILKEEAAPFIGKKITDVTGYAKIDKDRLLNQKVADIRTWGKHLLVCFKGFTLYVHFGLFGSYRINHDKKGSNPTLSLHFSNGELNCYVASCKYIEGDINNVYDWSFDMLSPEWNAKKVKQKLLEEDPGKQIGDLLLKPEIFTGVGNIIRNEVLYRVKLHPESKLGAIPSRKLTEMIKQTHTYSLDFLKWKRTNELKKHWQVYKQKTTPAGEPVTFKKTGATKRNSFIAEKTMVKYT